jgi:hypothetical protein
MKTRTILTAALALALAGPAMAQTPSSLGNYNNWTAWSYTGQNGKVCYIYARPAEHLPSNLNHGDVSFFVRTSPSEGIAKEANFVAGYAFEENSMVTVDVDGRKFQMFTQGDSAWLVNAAEEEELVQAMRSGRQMTVTGKSRRGNETTYRYPLTGVTAATDKISDECS